MNRFSFAAAILASSVIRTDAFSPNSIAGSRTRSWSKSDPILPTCMSTKDEHGMNEQEFSLEQRVQVNAEDAVEDLFHAEQAVEEAVEQFVSSTSVVPPPSMKDLDDLKELEATVSLVLDEAADALNAANLALELEEVRVEEDVATVSVPMSAEDDNLEPEDEANDTIEAHEDEEISFAIAAVAKYTLGAKASRNYISVRHSLSDARGKNEKRLSRSLYEKEKASEKIAVIKARMEEQILAVEEGLNLKLNEIQGNFDEEMDRTKNLLLSQVQIESDKMEKMRALKCGLEEAIQSKSSEIKSEEGITAEMVEVRSKLKTGNISKQLDALIDEKRQLATFEQTQLDDLKAFVVTADSIIDNTKIRSQEIQKVIDNVNAIDIKQPGDVKYDFSNFVELEMMWEKAATDAENENVTILKLKKNFDQVLLNKIILLGEEVPEYLTIAASDLAIQKEAQVQGQELRNTANQRGIVKSSSHSESSIQHVDSMDAKGEYELLGVVASSLGHAALDSAKAGVLGVKAVIDTVNEIEVTAAGKQFDQNSLKAIGDAGRAIANNVGKAASASHASDALKDTSNDLGSVFKALGALGKKAAERMR